MRKAHNRIEYQPNQKINNLTFIREVESYISPSKNKLRRAEFKCYCNKKFVANISSVKSGQVRSCGCYKRERARAIMLEMNTKDNRSKLQYYRIWRSVIQRCYETKSATYKYYGGRGVKVCDEWLNPFVFNNWLIENGYKKGLQIDRINNDGNYEPSNCRFVTPAENSQNKSNTILTPSIVSEIRDYANSNKQLNYQNIGNKFGISRQLVNKVVNRKCWANI